MRSFLCCWQSLLVAALLLLVGWAVFGHLGSATAISYDDDQHVFAQSIVSSGLNTAAVHSAFNQPLAALYVPLAALSHALDVQLWGLDPGAHHLSNLAHHLLAAFLLFLFLSALLDSWGVAAVVALLWAFHPLQVEAVAWISERKATLSACFFWAACLSFVRWRASGRNGTYLLLLILVAAAMLSKPSAVCLPLVLVLIDRFQGRELSQSLSALRLPTMMAVGGVAVSLSLNRATELGAQLANIPWDERVWRFGSSTFHYLWDSLWPAQLSFYYPRPAVLPWWEAVAGISLLLVIAGLLLSRVRRHGWDAYVIGGGLFLLTLAPVCGLVPAGEFVRADHYAYLPLAGVLLVVTLLVRQWLPSAWQPIVAAAALALAAFFAHQQSLHWRDNTSLYSQALAVDQNNFLARNNLAAHHFNSGQHQEALVHFLALARSRPATVRVSWHVARCYEELGLPMEAAVWWKRHEVKGKKNEW